MRALLWLFCAVIAGLYIVSPVVDPDLWWHIAIGRWILAHGAVPTTEHWNLFALGAPFRAYSWMNEVVFAWIDAHFGLEGLFWGKVILAQLVALSFFYVFSKLSNDWFFGILLGFVAVVGCQSHYTFRPQSITWIYFVWLLYLTEVACRKGKLFPAAVGIVLCMSLWANIHITTALGLGAVLCWSFSKERMALSAWLLFFAALGTAITPYFGAEWITFLSKTDHPFMFSAIREFQPANILQYATGFSMLALFLLVMFFGFHPTLFPLVRLLYGGVLLLGGLAVIKFLPYTTIYLLAVIATGWRDARERGLLFGNFSEAIEKFEELFKSKRVPPEGLGFILVCLIFVLAKQVTQVKLDKEIVPKDAVDFIDEKKLQTPILHTFGYGGYMMRHFTNESGEVREKVMVDGRTNVTPHEINNYLDDARGGRREWRKILDIVKPNTILWVGDSPLISLLLLSGEWCVVFEEPETTLEHTVLIKREEVERRKDEFPTATCEGNGQ